jgi:hypothetical protein
MSHVSGLCKRDPDARRGDDLRATAAAARRLETCYPYARHRTWPGRNPRNLRNKNLHERYLSVSLVEYRENAVRGSYVRAIPSLNLAECVREGTAYMNIFRTLVFALEKPKLHRLVSEPTLPATTVTIFKFVITLG